MTPKKLRVLLILAIVCIVLFGTLFWIITPAADNGQGTNTETIPQGVATGNVELGTITTGATTTTAEETEKLATDLTILLPGRFYNDGFLQLAQLLKKKYGLILHYKKIDNIGYYKQIIEDKTHLDGVDLYLMPTDRIKNYSGKHITFSEDIAPYVHPIFSTYQENSLMPYAIDPLVTLTPSSTTLHFDDRLTLQDIANFIALDHGPAQLGSKTNKIKMPILRGIDKNDKKILDQGKESFPNYFILTYNIINGIYAAGLESNYNILLDTINNPGISKRSYANFKITFSKLLKKNPNCVTFPDICIIAYNYGDIKFGFLSDINIEQKYFGGTGSKITDLTIYNFPITTNKYKVRGWGFVADKDTKKDKAIQVFAKEYIKAGANNEIPLRENSLSAFNAILDIQKTQKKYELIFKFEPQFSLMLYSTDLQEQFLKNTNFIPMIQEKTPANGIGGFFEPTSRDW